MTALSRSSTAPARAPRPAPSTPTRSRPRSIRHGLNSAADQMKRALIRTAFSPVIYEVLDFAVAIYDREVRLLAQAPSLPLFMGTLSFCVEAAVEAVGGEEALEPGDIILYNVPYGTGSHPQDAAVVMPVFLDDEELIGYAAIKGHWLDIGGKEPYSTDTVDVFQEGTIFPGVKLYRRGRARRRHLPDGARQLARAEDGRGRHQRRGRGRAHRRGGARCALVERYGLETFRESVERMFDHGEAVVRELLRAASPTAATSASGEMDDNGVDDEPVPFEVARRGRRLDVRVDYSNAPDAAARARSTARCPSTVSGEPHRDHDARRRRRGAERGPLPRRSRSSTRPGLDVPPALAGAVLPLRLAGAAGDRGRSTTPSRRRCPTAVPACSGGDICALVWWGVREGTGEPWADGSPHPVGQGASRPRRRRERLMHHAEAATRFSPTEVWEAKNPWLIEQVELAPDSCGAGQAPRRPRRRHALPRCSRTPMSPPRSSGRRPRRGGSRAAATARPNAAAIRHARRVAHAIAKATRLECRRARRSSSTAAAAAATARPAERDAARCRMPTSARATSPRNMPAQALPARRSRS